MNVIRRIIANKFDRAADEILFNHPGPHYDGTIGAEWCRLAASLRALANDIRP